MIDVKLVSKAKESSPVISAIDLSWRDYAESLKENIFTLPFKGNYSFIVEESSVLIEGYCGLLVIDRLYCNHKTYLLKTAIKQESFRILGMYDSRGRFDCFVARPEIGFHFMGMNNHGHSICTGDIEFTAPSSLDSLREISERIIQSFRLINMESLGAVILPKEHEKLKVVIDNRDEGIDTRVKKLLTEGLIEPIL
jgi:hypothetical protein